jgi:hypothetical protein
MKLLAILCGWLVWLTPILGAVIGWLVAGWLGGLVGLVAGLLAWLALLVLWVVAYGVAFSRYLDRRRECMRRLSNEQLRQIASDPISRDLGFAIGELDRRGIDARPSLESLLALLTSSDSCRRGRGLSLLHGLYPSVLGQFGMGCSSADAPEVWRARVAALRDGTAEEGPRDKDHNSEG